MKNIQQKQLIKVWITKYALTQDIFEKEVEICLNSDPTGNMVKANDNFSEYYHGEGKEWHRDYESAKEKAEQMRLDKIKSLKKQIEKLEKLQF